MDIAPLPTGVTDIACPPTEAKAMRGSIRTKVFRNIVTIIMTAAEAGAGMAGEKGMKGRDTTTAVGKAGDGKAAMDMANRLLGAFEQMSLKSHGVFREQVRF
jgi:hypothetical protein